MKIYLPRFLLGFNVLLEMQILVLQPNGNILPCFLFLDVKETTATLYQDQLENSFLKDSFFTSSGFFGSLQVAKWQTNGPYFNKNY